MHPTPVNIEPVSATLEYLQSALHRPVTHMLAPPGGHTWETGYYAGMPVTIRDGRGRAEVPSLAREGFQLCGAASAMRDFSDREAIERIYYREMEELARSVRRTAGSLRAPATAPRPCRGRRGSSRASRHSSRFPRYVRPAARAYA